MKLGLVGTGYWGQILLSNLKEEGFDIITYDLYDVKADTNKRSDLDSCDKVFIVTPVASHSENCRYFLSKGIDVFCEKPLVMSYMEAIDLYGLAEENECQLFVDWIFTYNNQVNIIKKLVGSELSLEDGSINFHGSLKSVSMNRLNLGPVRHDVSAKYDLASHDVSIILYMLGEMPKKANWIGYKRYHNSKTNDSCHGLLYFNNEARGDTIVQINASWHYGKKDRLCIFEFEKGFLTWDDKENILEFNGKNLFEEGPSPLKNSIQAFLSGNTEGNMDLTLNTLQVLEHENSF
tara:strand:- start:6529 stop:7404 length:876 start_codon:yes stop_codon:yes gene_type:complete